MPIAAHPHNINSKDPYKVLGLDRKEIEALSPAEALKKVSKAYKILAIKYHPDKNPGDSVADKNFRHATDAFDYFTNPGQRNNPFRKAEKTHSYKDERSSSHRRGSGDSYENFSRGFWGNSDHSGRKGYYREREEREEKKAREREREREREKEREREREEEREREREEERRKYKPPEKIVTSENYREFFDPSKQGAERFNFEAVQGGQEKHDADDPLLKTQRQKLRNMIDLSKIVFTDEFDPDSPYDKWMRRPPSKVFSEAAAAFLLDPVFRYDDERTEKEKSKYRQGAFDYDRKTGKSYKDPMRKWQETDGFDNKAHIGYCQTWKSSLITLMHRLTEPRWEGSEPYSLTSMVLRDLKPEQYSRGSGPPDYHWVQWRSLAFDLYLISNLDHSDPSIQADAVKALARLTGFMHGDDLSGERGKGINRCADLLANFCKEFRSDLIATVLVMDPEFEFVSHSSESLAKHSTFGDYLKAESTRLPPPETGKSIRM